MPGALRLIGAAADESCFVLAAKSARLTSAAAVRCVLMSNDPPTCHICGALITEKRQGELVALPGVQGLVWIHPACKGRTPRAPK
jgi:hypothetical protein